MMETYFHVLKGHYRPAQGIALPIEYMVTNLRPERATLLIKHQYNDTHLVF